MITRLWMGNARGGSSAESFRVHWRDRHAPIALRLPGLRAYVQNHPVSHGVPNAFDGCSELDFDDVAAMRAAFRAPVMADANEDEALFADERRFALVVTERSVLADGKTPADAVRLMTYLHANPAMGRKPLVAAIQHDAAASPALRHEVFVTLQKAHVGEVPPACDVVESLWFAGEDDAEHYRTSAAAVEAAERLKGLAFGRETVLVRPLRFR